MRAPEDIAAHAFWFGEDQARYLVTVPADRAEAVMQRVQAASVLVHRIGSTGGETIAIPGERAIAIKALAERFEGWLPAYMSGQPDLMTRPSGRLRDDAAVSSMARVRLPTPMHLDALRSRDIRTSPMHIAVDGAQIAAGRAFRDSPCR